MLKKQVFTVLSALLVFGTAQATDLHHQLPGTYVLTHEKAGSLVEMGCFKELTISLREGNIYFPLHTAIKFPTNEEQVCGTEANAPYSNCLSFHENKIVYKEVQGSGFGKLTKKSALSFNNGTLTYKHTEFTWVAPGLGNLLNSVICVYKKTSN